MRTSPRPTGTRAGAPPATTARAALRRVHGSAAHDHGDHALGLQLALQRGAHVGYREGLDFFRPLLEVVERQVVPGDVGDIREQLAVAVYAQRKAADEVVLGGAQLGLGRALGDVAAQHVLRHLHGLRGLVGARLQADDEGARVQAGVELAIDAVAEPALFAHFFGQARDQAAAAEDVVAHEQRKEIGVAPCDAGLADQHMRLRRGEGDFDFLRGGKRRHFGHGRQGGAALRRRR